MCAKTKTKREATNIQCTEYNAQVTVAMSQSNHNEQCKCSAITSTVTQLNSTDTQRL